MLEQAQNHSTKPNSNGSVRFHASSAVRQPSLSLSHTHTHIQCFRLSHAHMHSIFFLDMCMSFEVYMCV